MVVYDVSYCQPAGTVSKLASAGASGVIIRNGYMTKTDDLYNKHMTDAVKSFVGKMIGSYTYIMANDTDDAAIEAQNTIKRLTPFKSSINMPIYLDMESQKYCDPNAREKNTALLLLEIDYLRRAGFAYGVYTNQSFIQTYIKLDVIMSRFPKTSLWLADYRSKPYKPEYPVDIWQTGTKTVDTVKVDINKCYVDFYGRNKFFK